MRKSILCLTHSGDYYVIDRVMEALECEGFNPVRVNTDNFPENLKLSVSLNNKERNLFLGKEDLISEGSEIGGVWLRKISVPGPGGELDPAFRGSCIRESSAALMGWMSSLYHLPWMDLPEVMTNAENKILQLRLAADAGLNIPDTIIGNDPEKVKLFFCKNDGRVVTKMLTAVSMSMDASLPFMYTNKINEEDLESLDDLRFCPMIFQNLIEKEYELRVIYVDGEIFSGAIDAGSTVKGKVDWRLAETGECMWMHSELPDHVKEKLVILMNRLQLKYGAIDIIKKTEWRICIP